MRIIDHSGDTLTGAIDGRNVTYRTSLSFDPDSVEVFANGLNKHPLLTDGFRTVDDQTVILAEPRDNGDTLAIAYSLAGTASVGGQAGGVPPIAAVCQDAPPQAAVDTVPGIPTEVALRPPPFCAC